MPEKTFFKKILKIFKRRSRFGRNISIKEALGIQNKYAESLGNRGETYCAPYVEIATQLSSPKKEVFEAALYYLRRIAANRPEYAADIADLLQRAAADSRTAEERKLAVSAAAAEVKQLKS